MHNPRSSDPLRCRECRLHILNVPCDCGWNNGDHEPRCAKARAWDRAVEEHEEGI